MGYYAPSHPSPSLAISLQPNETLGHLTISAYAQRIRHSRDSAHIPWAAACCCRTPPNGSYLSYSADSCVSPLQSSPWKRRTRSTTQTQSGSQNPGPSEILSKGKHSFLPSVRESTGPGDMRSLTVLAVCVCAADAFFTSPCSRRAISSSAAVPQTDFASRRVPLRKLYVAMSAQQVRDRELPRRTRTTCACGETESEKG